LVKVNKLFLTISVQTNSGGEYMAKKKDQNKLFEDPSGVSAVKNQLFESYQSGVVEDQLHNNKGIWTFNNRKA
jgi:hypothetical protein